MKSNDVDETTEFYRERLGAELFDRGYADETGTDAVEFAALEIADKRLYVYDEPPYEAAGLVEEQPTGLLHFGFAVEDVDDAYEELLGDGVEFLMEPSDFGDLRVAFLVDPTGTLVELIEQEE
jgi:catechol 2,3-dioxygenase-like lactoylglutathione lyase family enzyme